MNFTRLVLVVCPAGTCEQLFGVPLLHLPAFGDDQHCPAVCQLAGRSTTPQGRLGSIFVAKVGVVFVLCNVHHTHTRVRNISELCPAGLEELGLKTGLNWALTPLLHTEIGQVAALFKTKIKPDKHKAR